MPTRPPSPYEFLPEVPNFSVSSSGFTDGDQLPLAQVFDDWGVGGANRSPQLTWTGFPEETSGFAVTCFDPDAPTGSGFWHWIVFNLPPEATQLAESAGSAGGEGLVSGGLHGPNDFGNRHYDGAAPPPGDGPHRYMFAVHALNVATLEGISEKSSAAYIGFNLTYATIARGLIVATYER